MPLPPLPPGAIPPSIAGFGEGWGSTLWGTSLSTALQVLWADAVSENVVRIVFNEPPTFTGLLDAADASRTTRYAVAPVVGSTGMDSLPARAVSVCTATQNLDVDPTGATIDVTVDRPFSPYPALYTVTVNGMTTATSDTLDPAASSYTFLGCSRLIIAPDPAKAIPSRDIANPQTLAGLLDAGTSDATALGTHPVDQTGDYATDEGLTNLKKRVFRRIMTAKGSFLHAPDYGIGIGTRIKRLNTPLERDALSTEAEKQIQQEPDVQKVRVLCAQGDVPSVVRLTIYIRTTHGVAVKFETPFSLS